MAFKPLTSNPKPDALLDQSQDKKSLPKYESLSEIKNSTEERIYLIFDDSGSMSATVPGSGTDESKALVQMSSNPYANKSGDKDRITLAQEATVDYMKNCKPHVSAVEIAPLNQQSMALTKNLPNLATQIKKIGADGGTELYHAMGTLVDKHKESKYTRALIFTDGEAADISYVTGHSYYGTEKTERPNLFAEIAEMGIPVDLIIIGDQRENQLSPNSKKLKELIESTGGTFMICRDGKSFKEKLKYFAPLLRHRLAAIASENSRGDS